MGSAQLAAMLATPTALTVMPGGQAAERLEATITRTTHGIPHIVGNSWDDLGFGGGYAFAEDNVCVMADTP